MILATIGWLPCCFASIVLLLYWVYMNGSRCQKIWTVGRRHLTRHQAQCQAVSAWVSRVTDVVVSRGARCEGVSCEVSVCEMVSSYRLQDVVASMGFGVLQGMASQER